MAGLQRANGWANSHGAEKQQHFKPFLAFSLFSNTKEITQVPACINHIRGKAAKNTADIPRHSGPERNSGNVFFFNCVTGANCFSLQLQLQKEAEDEGGARL